MAAKLGDAGERRDDCSPCARRVSADACRASGQSRRAAARAAELGFSICCCRRRGGPARPATRSCRPISARWRRRADTIACSAGNAAAAHRIGLVLDVVPDAVSASGDLRGSPFQPPERAATAGSAARCVPIWPVRGSARRPRRTRSAPGGCRGWPAGCGTAWPGSACWGWLPSAPTRYRAFFDGLAPRASEARCCCPGRRGCRVTRCWRCAGWAPTGCSASLPWWDRPRDWIWDELRACAGRGTGAAALMACRLALATLVGAHGVAPGSGTADHRARGWLHVAAPGRMDAAVLRASEHGGCATRRLWLPACCHDFRWAKPVR